MPANLLGVPPSGRRPDSAPQLQFELLGLKWLSKISVVIAKELTPYEVGDRRWRSSIQTLSSGTVDRTMHGTKLITLTALHCGPLVLAMPWLRLKYLLFVGARDINPGGNGREGKGVWVPQIFITDRRPWLEPSVFIGDISLWIWLCHG